ncbi:hypothetical protein ACFE04_007486 [Oxalis oulophora]
MDTLIWKKLPQELLDHILSFLPLKTLLSLRSTSKHFKSIIYSPLFVSKYSSTSCSSFLLLSHPQCYHQFPLYDSNVPSWRNLVVPFSDSSSSSSLLSVSNNGLLCFSLVKSSSFLLCNVFSHSSRVIKFPTYSFTFELLTLVSTPNAYYIFALCAKFSSNSVFVYNSKTHTWKSYEGFGPFLNENYHKQEGVLSKGCLYFTTPEPFSVVSFDLETGEWDRRVEGLPRELIFVRLVSNEAGELYLIGGTGANGISRRLKLWKLSSDDQGNNNWTEIESVPEMICKKFMSVCYHNYEHVYCFWHQGMICVCCYTWPEILYYKVNRRTWHWLPKCPSLPDKWSCGFKWFSFVPQLYALV